MDSSGLKYSDRDSLILETRLGSFLPIIGPLGWQFLMLWALGFPAPYVTDKDRFDWNNSLTLFAVTFGCKTCSDDMVEYIQKNPVDLTSRITLFWWVWRFHNYVNAKLGKPFFTEEQAIEKYLVNYQDLLNTKTFSPHLVSSDGKQQLSEQLSGQLPKQLSQQLSNPLLKPLYQSSSSKILSAPLPTLSQQVNISSCSDDNNKNNNTTNITMLFVFSFIILGIFLLGWFFGKNRSKINKINKQNS